MSVQVYGHFDGNGSFDHISRAIVRALRRRGVSGQVFEVKTLQPVYRDVAWPIGLNSRAEVGICVEYPLASVGYLMTHPHRILVTVCEADRVPREWVEACNKMDLVVVPSTFCQKAFAASGVEVPILVVPHGVDEQVPFLNLPTASCPSAVGGGRNDPSDDTVRLFHVSGAASFPKRKGTAALLAAFARVKDRFPRVELHLRVAESKGLWALVTELQLDGRVWLDLTELPSPVSMAQHLMTYDAVVQPSRGEGFGIVPLEARCVGTPVVMTAETGHLMHYVPGVDIRVRMGRVEPMATQGNHMGSTPTLSIAAVEAGLVDLLTDLPAHRERTVSWAKRYAKDWVWPKVLAPLSKHVTSYAKSGGPLRLGQEAGLRGY